jgi:methylglutamate dehydrogenase subunit D
VAEHSLPRFAPGRTGSPSGPAGVLVHERSGIALVGVQARRDGAERLAAAVRREFDIALPTEARAISSGPGRWLVLAEGAPPVLEERLQRVLGDHGAICDQSDGRVLLDLSGPRLLETLAKGVPVDLHPSRFGPGAVALTTVSHVGVQLWRSDTAPQFHLLVPRSYFGSFWNWLAASAAEFGCEVVD